MNDTNHIVTITQIDPLNVEVFVPIAYYDQTRVMLKPKYFWKNPSVVDTWPRLQ